MSLQEYINKHYTLELPPHPGFQENHQDYEPFLGSRIST